MTTSFVYFLLFVLGGSLHARPILLLPNSIAGKTVGRKVSSVVYWFWYTLLIFLVIVTVATIVLGTIAGLTQLTFQELITDWRVLLTVTGLAFLANGHYSFECVKEDAESAALDLGYYDEVEQGKATAFCGLVLGATGFVVGLISLFGVPLVIWLYHLCKAVHLYVNHTN